MKRDRPKVAKFEVLPTPYRQPLLDRLAALDDIDVHVHFLSESEADRTWSVDVSGPKMHVLPRRTLRVNKGGKPIFYHVNTGIGALLARERYDCVVVPGWAQPASVRVLSWCRRHRVPAVIHSETHRLGIASSTRDRIKRLAVKRIVRGAAGGLAVGSAAKSYLAGLGVPEDRIWFFSNTPDVEAIASRTDALRAERQATRNAWGLGQKHVALFVGRLIPAKAPLDLIDAYERVVSAGVDCGLAIVGDGEMERAVRACIAEKNLAGVKLLGFKQGDELLAAYAAADLFVLPSVQEPWGAVVNEAAAAALPLLLTDVVGAGVDLVETGRNGFRTPASNPDAFADAWIRLLSDADVAAWGARSRETARRWGYDAAVEQFRQCVLTVTGRQP